MTSSAGDPVSAVIVQAACEERGVQLNDLSDADGAFDFRNLAPGSYRVSVDPASLGPGYVAPFRQEACRGGVDWPDYLYATCVEVPEVGGDFVVALKTFAASTVLGRVDNPWGGGASGVIVRLQGDDPGAQGLSYDVKTNGLGEFRVDDVLPAGYRVYVYPEGTEYVNFARPKVLRFALPSRDTLVLPTLAFRVGPTTVTGAVFDQQGRPVVGIAVLCLADPGTYSDVILITGTNESGRFEFAALPREPVSVVAGLSGYTGYEDVQLQGRARVVRLDLRELADSVELAHITLVVNQSEQ